MTDWYEPPAVHRGQCGACRRCRSRGSIHACATRAARLHRAQHSGVDGRALSLPRAVPGDGGARGRARAGLQDRVRDRLSEPQRPSRGSLARARYLRLSRAQARAGGPRGRRCSAPLGFICDHVEVLYDLDIEAAEVCREIGLPMVARAGGQRSPALPRHDGRRGAARLPPLRARAPAGTGAGEYEEDCWRSEPSRSWRWLAQSLG